MEEQTKQRIVELHPVSKWKRILLFLGDYFIAFILSFTLFNLAVFPLAKVICNTQKRNNEINELNKTANDLLINDKVIFEDPNGTFEFVNHVNYTFKVFLSYYAFDEESPSTKYKDFGHKKENEVIRNYYINHLKDEAGYISSFNEVNQKDNFFNIGTTSDSVTLKDEYKLSFANELLEISDDEKYSASLISLRDNVFARLFYLHVYDDIQKNDYVSGGVSYLECLNKVKKINESLKWVPAFSAIIAATLSWSMVYLLFPLTNDERKTITGKIMKLTRLRTPYLINMSIKDSLIRSFYELILSMSSVLFLPVLYFGMAYCFNLPMLFVIFMISLSLILISLIFVLFNQFNRSGSDLLSMSVMIPDEEIDNIYKEEDEGSIPS